VSNPQALHFHEAAPCNSGGGKRRQTSRLRRAAPPAAKNEARDPSHRDADSEVAGDLCRFSLLAVIQTDPLINISMHATGRQADARHIRRWARSSPSHREGPTPIKTASMYTSWTSMNPPASAATIHKSHTASRLYADDQKSRSARIHALNTRRKANNVNLAAGKPPIIPQTRLMSGFSARNAFRVGNI